VGLCEYLVEALARRVPRRPTTAVPHDRYGANGLFVSSVELVPIQVDVDFDEIDTDSLGGAQQHKVVTVPVSADLQPAGGFG
jgi:hypothetical protein